MNNPGRPLTIILFLIILIASGIPLTGFAHGEEITISEGRKGPVKLSPEQVAMLQVETAKVKVQPLAELLTLNGQIELVPNAQANVSVRISGSVTALSANLGEDVLKGQRLATIQSRLIGNPPPSVAVFAPISGIIDARNVTLGQAVEPDTIIFHISNREQLLVIAKVYEEDLSKVKLGQQANIYVLSYPKQVFTGTVTLIEPNLDELTRTVNVQIRLVNKDKLLKPGMFARTNLVLNKNNTALTVPVDALLEANEEQFVFVRKGFEYDRKVVTTGATDNEVTEITSGLHAGDEVVTQGNRQIYTLWLSGSNHSKASHKDPH
ncbi:MAG: efflux RND transporter periplasmic adaptor subunit [Legionella sp.]|nr:efflux RND transporter periplasmic adaptor subunit [Legionella sp.]